MKRSKKQEKKLDDTRTKNGHNSVRNALKRISRIDAVFPLLMWSAEMDRSSSEIYLSAKPWKSNADPKIKIYVHRDRCRHYTLYEPGLRIHLQNAFKYGATKEEILEVYQLVSVLGMHTITMGVPVLIEEMDAAGLGGEVDRNFSPRQLAIKEEFIKHRGYWSGFWEDLLALDPDFLEIYQKFSSLPWQRGHLEPKVKEFVYIAIDVATTPLQPGLRIHIQNAPRYGATVKKSWVCN